MDFLWQAQNNFFYISNRFISNQPSNYKLQISRLNRFWLSNNKTFIHKTWKKGPAGKLGSDTLLKQHFRWEILPIDEHNQTFFASKPLYFLKFSKKVRGDSPSFH